jgi:hypothetical protein
MDNETKLCRSLLGMSKGHSSSNQCSSLKDIVHALHEGVLKKDETSHWFLNLLDFGSDKA